MPTPATTTILRFAGPIAVGQLMQSMLSPVSLFFLGRLGPLPMGAFSMSVSVFNATAGAAIIGLASSLDTILSHIAGAGGRDPNYGNSACRAYLLIIIVTIPFAALFSWIDVVFTLFGLPADIVLATTTYTRVNMFQMPFVLCNEITRRYIQNRDAATPIAVINGIALAEHTALQFILVEWVGYGLWGSALGWVIVQASVSLMSLFYITYIARSRFAGTWVGVTGALVEDWAPILREGMSSWGMTLVEWSAFEVSNLTAGYLSPNELAAYSLVLQTYYQFWMVSIGVGIAGSVFVGQAVGSGNPTDGRAIALKTLGITAAWTTIGAITMSIFGKRIAEVFTNDATVVTQALDIFHVIVVFSYLDQAQSCYINLTRSIAKQRIGAAICFCTWILIGIPLNLLLAFRLGFGAPGLFMGLTIACVLVSAPCFTWYFFVHLRWERLLPVSFVTAGGAKA